MGPIRQGRRHGGITHRLVMRLHSGTGATRRLGQVQEGRDTALPYVRFISCYAATFSTPPRRLVPLQLLLFFTFSSTL